MRTKTITYTQDVYTYDELDEYAQQQVRNNNMTRGWEDGTLHEDNILIVNAILAKYGFSQVSELRYDTSRDGIYPVFSTGGAVGELNIAAYIDYLGGGQVANYVEVFDLNGNDFGLTAEDAREDTYPIALEFAERLVMAIANEIRFLLDAEEAKRGTDEYAREQAENLGLEFDIYGNVV